MANPTAPEQRSHDKKVEDDIKNKLFGDTGKGADPVDPPQPSGSDPKNVDLPIDNPTKKPDTKNEPSVDHGGVSAEQEYDALVQDILAKEYDGDTTMLAEARSVANLTLDTFQGDPIKAAKSYLNLNKQSQLSRSQLQKLKNTNPFLTNLLEEAEKGTVIDENYVRGRLGSSNQPAQPKAPDANQLATQDDLHIDMSKLTVDDLSTKQSANGRPFLDRNEYDKATNITRQEMLAQARINYVAEEVPNRIVKRTQALSEKAETEREQKSKVQKAVAENQKRIDTGLERMLTKYRNIDFDNDPKQATLVEEINRAIASNLDYTDPERMLYAEDAMDRAISTVFAKHGIDLVPLGNTETPKPPGLKVSTTSRNNNDALKRILTSRGVSLTDVGRQTQPSSRTVPKQDVGSTINDRVNSTITNNLERTRMVRGLRQHDKR